MIEKQALIEFDGVKNYYSIILGNDGLEKLAANLSDEISQFIKTHDFDTKKYLYVLINALGADEYYGPNKNGDGFPEYYEGKESLLADSTEYGYKTFQEFAKLFKHHANKNTLKAYGDVLLSIYNHNMHRVELVVRMDREKAPEECAKVEAGEILSTSMGTRVGYDVCSICGNKAKKRSEYCFHLKNMMNKVLPDGTKVYAINPFPKFFDISMVFVPADVTSRVMIKIASEEKSAVEKKIAVEKKTADIDKEVPVESIESTSLDDILDQLINKKVTNMEKREMEIPTETINRLCEFPLDKILSTLGFSGIMPKPREFQRIVLIKLRKPQMADMLDKQNVVFNPQQYDSDADLKKYINISDNNIDEDVFKVISDYIPMRSRWQPFLLDRLMDDSKLAFTGREETADNLIPIMLAVSGLYSLFKNVLPKVILSSLAGAIGTHPIIAGGVIANNIAGKALGPMTETRTYSPGTINAQELLKLSSLNEEIFKFMCRKYDIDKNNFKKVANTLPSKVYSLGKGILKSTTKGGFGFSPSNPSWWRRAAVAFPVVGLASGWAKSKKLTGQPTNAATDIVANHPLLTAAAITAFGHKPPGWFMKTSSYKPDTLELLFRDGELLDALTVMKIGEMF